MKHSLVYRDSRRILEILSGYRVLLHCRQSSSLTPTLVAETANQRSSGPLTQIGRQPLLTVLEAYTTHDSHQLHNGLFGVSIATEDCVFR